MPDSTRPTPPEGSPLSTGLGSTVLLAVVSVLLVYAAAVVAIAVFADPAEAGIIIPLLLATLAPVIPSMFAFIMARDAANKATSAKSVAQEIKISVDGRLTQLLELTERAAADQATLAALEKQALKEAGIAAASDVHTTTSTTSTTTTNSPPSGQPANGAPVAQEDTKP